MARVQLDIRPGSRVKALRSTKEDLPSDIRASVPKSPSEHHGYLVLEAGEIVEVQYVGTPGTDDDGWGYGVHEGTGQKGWLSLQAVEASPHFGYPQGSTAVARPATMRRHEPDIEGLSRILIKILRYPDPVNPTVRVDKNGWASVADIKKFLHHPDLLERVVAESIKLKDGESRFEFDST
ncbi:unnamed protein product, partial [Symbiodinium pilosum]